MQIIAQKLKNALRDRRGETIVEVLVAFVLLMLFLALFTASLRFARRASAQAQTTRDNAYLLTEALYPVNDDAADWKNESGTKIRMSFSRGDRTVFAVEDVELQTIQAATADGTNHTFTRYYKKMAEDKDNTKEDTTP